MFFLNTRLLVCNASDQEVNTFTDAAIHIAFQKRHDALLALYEKSEEENFRRWARSRRVYEVPQIFEIISQAAFQCHHISVSARCWEQFKTWRQSACPFSPHTDTITSVYFTFIQWNRHKIPQRIMPIRKKSGTGLVPLDVVDCKKEDVIDQRVRQSAPTVRLPQRNFAAILLRRLARPLKPRKLEEKNFTPLAVVATNLRE